MQCDHVRCNAQPEIKRYPGIPPATDRVPDRPIYNQVGGGTMRNCALQHEVQRQLIFPPQGIRIAHPVNQLSASPGWTRHCGTISCGARTSHCSKKVGFGFGGHAMAEMAFRAWDGGAMVYDIAVNRKGVALQRISPDSEDGIVAYEPHPTWIVSRWSGLTDREGTRIFGHDVVELGGIHDTVAYAAVSYSRGHFGLWYPTDPVGASLQSLEKYRTPTFVHMIKVVGTVFDERWRELFSVLRASISEAGSRARR